MEIAICDDDKYAAARLKGFTEQWISTQSMPIMLHVFDGSEAFLHHLEGSNLDFAFLDIRLDALSGLDIAKIIRKRDSFMMIVFVTNHKQYAIQGFRVNAYDYLTKPVDESECRRVLDVALNSYRKRVNDVFTFRNSLQQIIVPKIDILYFQSQGHYVRLQKASTGYDFRMPIKDLIDKLPYPQFVRCNKNSIVNMYHVDCVYSDHVVMSNGDSISITANRREEVNNCYFEVHMNTNAPGTVYSI